VERFVQQKTKDLTVVVIMYANVKKTWFEKVSLYA
jgi:hypothetical protein